ncbi:SdpI family protein [Pseudonocardiaceae bacterium YIM PH 21723]|nr:SdpI family protein [Pseudonocardiaceae bacterium YIM PH 21723]
MTDGIVVSLIAVLLVLISLGLCWLFAALGAGRIKRNHFVGIRIPSTLRSDAAWYAGHRAARGPSLLGSALSVLPAIGSAFTVDRTHIVFILAWVLLVVGGVMAGAIAAHRAAAVAG